MRLHLRFAILVSLIALGGCATAAHAPLPSMARDKISSTDVVLPIRQSEIYVFVPNSQVAAATGGGLLFALVDAAIDSARTSKAEDAVKPLRDALVGFNFDEALQGEVKKSLSEVPWMHVADVRVIKEVTSDSMDRALTDSRSGAVLFAEPDYHLSNEGDLLVLKVKVSLFPNDDALRALSQNKSNSGAKTAPERALYRNTLTFSTGVSGSTGDRDANMKVWSADSGAAVRVALNKGAAKLAVMLAEDLQQVAEEMSGTAGAKGTMPSVVVDGVSGQIVRNDDDGDMVRFGDGTLGFVAK